MPTYLQEQIRDLYDPATECGLALNPGDRFSMWVNGRHQITATLVGMRVQRTEEGQRPYARVDASSVMINGFMIEPIVTEVRLWRHYGRVTITRGGDVEARVWPMIPKQRGA